MGIFKFRHLKNRLLFQNALSITFIICVIVFITYFVSMKYHIKEANRYNSIMVKQLSQSVDNMIESFNRVMNGVTFNQGIQNLLITDYANEKDKNILNSQLLSKVADETVLFNEVDYLFLYDLNNLRVSTRRTASKGNYESFKELKESLYDSSGKINWKMKGSSITANRTIYDIHSLKIEKIGYLTMTLDKSYLYNRIEKFEPTEDRYIVILDNNDNLVLSNSEFLNNNSDIMNNFVSDEITSSSIIDIPEYGKMVMNSYHSDLTGWKIISLVNMSEIVKGPTLIGKTIVVVGILSIIISFFLIWINTHYIVSPLHKLSVVMDAVERDHFDVQVQINRSDELGRVGESFNRMMNKINTLISDIYKKELNEKDAELRALRAQINPHFLYNTLDTINWMAQFGETEDISKMTIALSRLLKSSIANSNHLIRLEEELKYIDDYMTIQQIRFQDKVHYSINMDEQAKNYLVPKLILQPIVENAMIHGIEKKVENSYLLIQIKVVNDDLYIQVIDNGVGMGQKKISELLNETYTSPKESDSTGKGIANVQNRIKLLFGHKYTINIQSGENVGTIFEIILPVIVGGEENVKNSNI